MKDMEHYANRTETLITAFLWTWFYFYFETEIAKNIALFFCLMLYWNYFELKFKKPPKEIKPSCPFCGRKNIYIQDLKHSRCRDCERQWTN